MKKAKIQPDTDALITAIIEGIHRKKGLDVVKINLSKINHTECNYFVVCHGTSNTQVDAIARSVEETVQELVGEKAWHKDGYKNSLWILLDYADVMVHVFQRETRNHYDIETLWADAPIEKVEDDLAQTKVN